MTEICERDKIVGVAAESLCCSDGCATYRQAVGFLVFFIARSAIAPCAQALAIVKKSKNLRKPANVGDRSFPGPKVAYRGGGIILLPAILLAHQRFI